MNLLLWIAAIEEEKRIKETLADIEIPPMTWKDWLFILAVGCSPIVIAAILTLFI